MFDGKALPNPKVVLRSRINRGIRELLIQWEVYTTEDKTWKRFDQFPETYPGFELKDKLNTEREP